MRRKTCIKFLAAAKDFIERQHKAAKPWLCYFNSTRMHIWTHLKPESQGRTGLGVYPDGMVETDAHVGQLLKLLDDLNVANNTIVVYTTDNGAEVMTWPDGGEHSPIFGLRRFSIFAPILSSGATKVSLTTNGW